MCLNGHISAVTLSSPTGGEKPRPFATPPRLWLLADLHMELAEKYMADSYIQHNPNVPTGRAAFVEFFQRVTKPKPIEPKVKAPLVAIVVEGDLVVLSFVSQVPDRKDPGTKSTTTWFDMFRIENGKIAEHWDPATKR